MIKFREKQFSDFTAEGNFATPELSEGVRNKIGEVKRNFRNNYRHFKTNPGRAVRNGLGTAISRPDIALQLAGDKAIMMAHPAYAAVPVSLTMASPVTGDAMNATLSAGPLKKYRIPARMRRAKQQFVARPGSPAANTDLAKTGQSIENGVNRVLKFIAKRKR